uniref:Phosphatidylinositol-4-phosphate 3-kinase catalytic subunit type 2 beta n=1 Tax=Callorhinchus milii TaxID=7868 RepID=A0A4W3J3E0_CALMI
SLPPFLPPSFPPSTSTTLQLGGSTVDLIVYHALCYIHDSLRGIDVNHFVLKLCGLEEFLHNKQTLGSHQYIHFCRKFEVDIKLQLLELQTISRSLSRTVSVRPSVRGLGFVPRRVVADLLTGSRSKVGVGVCCSLRVTCSVCLSLSPFLPCSYEDFYLSCSLSHGGKELCNQLQTKKAHVYKYLFHLLIWDQNICFPINVNQLPRETLLTVSLFAFPLPPPGSSSEGNKQRRAAETMGWVTMPLFNFRHPKYDFNSLDSVSRKNLKEVMQKKSLFWLNEADKKLLWEKRYYCHSESSCLPLVLASAPSWEWACLPDIYMLLEQWRCLTHLDALGLLHATFPDQRLRHTAVQWMETMSGSELVDFLPQLVQAVKYECYLDSPLVRFLLRRAICDVKIAHHIYWLLKDALKDSEFSARYQHVLGALLCCVGKGLREEFDKQTKLVQILAKVAQRVRDSALSSRQAVLRENMEEIQHFFKVQNHCRLPLNPSLLATGVNLRDCSFFNSNAVPLKISFINGDSNGDNINVIFKTGDDLRQDMLTLQMIHIMNKIWLQEGLDMRMIFFKCTSTGCDRGMVEMIPNAETLRKIQVEHGVTGSFKDHPLAEWLQKHNASEEEYEKAVENFIFSCAGCCVATYVLGICDRHNDNIMLKTSGHMFHIDFGKFLGHAQMLGNFKRDRAPFVFTSDMAYVINGGDKPSSRFHDFVDLCCQAYNLLRKHTDLFLNLLGLMLSCGIPELSDVQDLRYVYDTLRPQDSESHATTYFTRLIESSLGSVATKLNFFFHNLAQMKFVGTDDRPTLSFAPKTHTLKSDGKIKMLFVCHYQKIFNPIKGYTFVVKVDREGQHEATFVLRTFEEFHELHNRLRLMFPASKLPRLFVGRCCAQLRPPCGYLHLLIDFIYSFPSRFVLGRSRGEAMADRRKEELNGYVWHLINCPPEVAECDLVYTFFHQLPKDDKSGNTSSLPKATDVPPTPPMGKVGGEVKLSISYKNDTLFIMVMHIRGLVLQDGKDPDPYVKIYLLPDPQKTSKRKTKMARKTCNPTYNEMLVYGGIPRGDVQQRTIHLRVLSEEAFRENFMLGEVFIKLKDFDLNLEAVSWYHLGSTTSQGTLI